MKVLCQYCGSPSKVIKRDQTSTTESESLCSCSNPECDCQFVVVSLFKHYTSPPKPEIEALAEVVYNTLNEKEKHALMKLAKKLGY